ncbi:hypothetical protein TSOC_012300 [Tetrabaena socialis]|uniref:Ankyrin repeat domain-containing protein n=1 Tax=Tetrabaena socialis TaxID=47790 RepID=A0A2J7ZND4_9CHLO|nr:hypothetical protein TSOC_012300 [Tetrabaena socialis]|eukprot:PNH01775.1 hypothetical protein TSOC_012300 [Tetrabaena socialis]
MTRQQEAPEEPPAPCLVAEQEVGSASAAAKDPFCALPPELLQRIADLLPPNEVACVLRLASKAMVAQLRRPQDRTVRLWLPVPHPEFVRRWGGDGAMRSLIRVRRTQLPALVAASGSIPNLEFLLARIGRPAATADPDFDKAIMSAAAGAGQVEVCRWLRGQGFRYASTVLPRAAAGGHRAACEWLLADGCPVDRRSAGAAARGGHVGLMDWLLGAVVCDARLLEAAAAGCDLPTLQRLQHTYMEKDGAVLASKWKARMLTAAVSSPTADWRDKVEWLEAQGCRPQPDSSCAAALLPGDQRPRVEWLRQRGYPLTSGAAERAAAVGNMDLLQFILAAGVSIDDDSARRIASKVARGGHLALLQALLHAWGEERSGLRHVAGDTALGGHLRVVAWLLATLGAADVLTVATFRDAACSGSMELLAWLHARGCPWDQSVHAAARRYGSEEQVEWLASMGCPTGGDGEPHQP